MHKKNDPKFGERLRWLRKNYAYPITQEEVADNIGVKRVTYQRYEYGFSPNKSNLKEVIEFYCCNKLWLLTGRGEPFDNQEAIDKKKPLYNKVETLDMHVAAPGVEYNDGLDDFGKASAGLKEIFDSGDPVLIPVIQANIHAFQISVRREAHIQEQTKEISDLKKRLDVLERHIKEGDRRKGDRRMEDLGPPNGIERRSGSDRRKISAGG